MVAQHSATLIPIGVVDPLCFEVLFLWTSTICTVYNGHPYDVNRDRSSVATEVSGKTLEVRSFYLIG